MAVDKAMMSLQCAGIRCEVFLSTLHTKQMLGSITSTVLRLCILLLGSSHEGRIFWWDEGLCEGIGGPLGPAGGSASLV